MLRSARARLPRDSWLLYSIQIRKAARKAFDLTHFGHGAAERIASAMVLGAAFFLAAFLIAHFSRLKTDYVIGIALVAFVSVMATSSALVLWKSDTDLEDQSLELGTRLVALRELAAEERMAAAEQRAVREAEKAHRAAEREAEEARRAVEREAEQAHLAAIEAAKPRPTTKRCPYCQEHIQIQAVKCKHCGEILDEKLRKARQPQPPQQTRPPQRWNPGVAAVLSFLIPGLGQMYKGQVISGFAWMFLVFLGYGCFLFPGFFLHVICVFGAASGSE